MKRSIDIRQLVPDDAPAYKALRLEASRDGWFGISQDAERAYTVALLRETLNQNDGSYLLGAFVNQRMIAMVGFGRGMSPSTGTLFGLFVQPEWRRSGIGQQLCKALIEREAGTDIKLEVRPDNLSAIKLYESLGFLIVDRGPESLTLIRQSYS